MKSFITEYSSHVTRQTETSAVQRGLANNRAHILLSERVCLLGEEGRWQVFEPPKRRVPSSYLLATSSKRPPARDGE